jgi:O-acetylhomoserine (thiol)-lyase
MEKHISNTKIMLDYLTNNENVTWVNHPSLPDHPDHEIAMKLMPKGPGSMIAFGIKGGRDAGQAFINAMKLTSHLANVGDAKSLVIHPASTTHSQMDKQSLELAGLTEDMIRFSVGLEDMEDIMNDFDNGFRASQKPRLVASK